MQNCDRTIAFICYCHRDLKYLNRLHVHLAFYERHGQMEIWDDKRILPGALWREEISKALLCTKVAILLVSADFLASNFIAENELPPLLAAAKSDGAIILPVILGPCRFSDSELSRFQAFNDPSKPLSSMNFNAKEEVWDRVAEAVKDVMNYI